MSPRPKSSEGLVKAEVKKQNLEIAAIAAVQMEYGTYKYPPNSQRVFDENGDPTWNKSELCRLACVPSYAGAHTENVTEHPYFIEMVELHRMRRTDPMFRQKIDDPMSQWREIGKGALDNIYEQVKYSPHSVSLEQSMKIVKLVLDAGAYFDRAGGPDNRTQDIIDTLTPEQRERVLAERKRRALAQIKSVESLEAAHRGADSHEQQA